MVVEHVAAAHAAHHAGHAVHAVFVRMLHTSVGTMAASAALARIYADVTPPEEVVEAKKKTEEGEEMEEEGAKEEEERATPPVASIHEQLCQRRATALTLVGGAVGAGAGLVLAIPAAHFGWGWAGFPFCLKWGHTFIAFGKSCAFQALPIALLFSIGPEAVADKLPGSLGGMVLVTAAISVSTLPLTLINHRIKHDIGYVLAGLRVISAGTSAVMVALFATRYANLQWRKLVSDDSATVSKINTGSIIAGQGAGYMLSCTWLYVGLTEWAGRVYPEWVHELPEVYFIAAMVHMLAPSPDHDTKPSTLMTRSALVGAHALVFIPHVHDHTWHTAQMIIGLSLTAGWFGTFEGEWNRDATGHVDHEEHEQAEKVEVCAEGAEALGRASHACSIM